MPCPYNNQNAADQASLERDICASLSSLSGQQIAPTTSLRDPGGLGYDTETVRLVGNGIEGRLRQGDCVVHPIPDAAFDGCNTVRDLANLIWRYLV